MNRGSPAQPEKRIQTRLGSPDGNHVSTLGRFIHPDQQPWVHICLTRNEPICPGQEAGHDRDTTPDRFHCRFSKLPPEGRSQVRPFAHAS